MRFLARLSWLAVLLSSPTYAQQQWLQSPVNSHWYTLTVPTDWFNAEYIAQTWTGHLVTIRSSTEQAWLRASFPTASDFWIGIANHIGPWAWTSGEPVVYTFWTAGEPNNAMVNCCPPCNFNAWEHHGVSSNNPPGSWADFKWCEQFPGVVELASDDCDNNGIPDRYEIAMQPSLDLNFNGVLDTCDQVQSYCTAGTTVHGCVPAMTGTGTPSASAANGFVVAANSVEGQRYGTIFYGFYPTATPWAPASFSYKCVSNPVQRTGVIDSAGTVGQCDGVLSLDFNSWARANPSALGSPFVQGQTIYAQGWFRDPGAPKQTNLSDALRFVLDP